MNKNVHFTIIALNDNLASHTGFRYVVRFEPDQAHDFWCATQGQFEIHALLTNNNVAIEWLQIELDLNAVGLWREKIFISDESMKGIIADIDKREAVRQTKYQPSDVLG